MSEAENMASEDPRPWRLTDLLGGPRVELPSSYADPRWLGAVGDYGDEFHVRDVEGRECCLVALTGVRNPDAVRERLEGFLEVEVPNFRAVHTIVPHEHHVLYTTDLPSGRSLAEGELFGWEPFDLALPLAMAVAGLHQAGLVHGYVDPENIVLNQAGVVMLGHPAPELPRGAAPSDDWRGLGRILRRWCSPGDEAPLIELVRGLESPEVDPTSLLFRLLVEFATRRQAFRYRTLGQLGRGGMAVVRRVRDGELDRELAMKVLLRERNTEREIARFDREAKLTAMLQHPSVAPVYTRGVTQEGQPFFTMKVIEGVTLGQAIRGRLGTPRPDGVPPEHGPWTLRQLVEALKKAAEAVAYAHERGIVHRDLKPSNILLGEHGAVYVSDWGLAKVVGSFELTTGDAAGSPEVDATQHGAVVGTLGYLPPEQNGGDPSTHCPASDVFALGVCLHEILTGERPSRPTIEATSQSTEAARDLLSGADVPHALAALCARCTADDIADRPANASEFVDGLRAWLDRLDATTQATALLVGVERLWKQTADHRAEAHALRARASERLRSIPSHAPEDEKAEPWTMQDRADELEREAERLDVEILHRLQSALEIQPDLSEAREMRRDFYLERLRSAELERDTRSATRYAQTLRRLGHGDLLTGSGALTLVTDPPGAEVTLCRWERHHRRLRAVAVRVLGRTPLEEVSIPAGSWLLEIRREPGADGVVRYPIQIDRGEHWDGVPPGASEPHAIWLPENSELLRGENYVPAGWFSAGGDPEALDGIQRRRFWCDGMTVMTHPVTNSQYLEFLNSLVDQGQHELADRFQPRKEVAYDSAPVYLGGRGKKYSLDSSEPRPAFRYDANAPVVGVEWWGACAYAKWYSDLTNRRWGLLHEFEWEKAARGVDGRCFPWGDHLDPSYACMRNSHAGEPGRADVDDYPIDRSPYEVRGLGGNVKDWCANGFQLGKLGSGADRVPRNHIAASSEGYRAARGGSWANREAGCRIASRFGEPPTGRSLVLGFRLRRYLGPPAT